jgi:peptide/nickel transport system ATP-binding protein
VHADNILVCKNITKKYSLNLALDQVSLHIKKGESLGLVGESGSGKSTLVKCLLMLEKVNQGQIYIKGNEMTLGNKDSTKMLRREVQAVFQNPAASLNPKLKIIDSLLEPLDCQKDIVPSFLTGLLKERKETAKYLLEMVEIPGKYMDYYPHELSGGQKQRVSIARAISIQPSIIILDEPTASLDVSIQAKILNLLKDLQEELNLSYLFISHDLAAVNFMSHRVMVMQNGIIVDECNKKDLFAETRHPYTKLLLQVFEG